MANVVEILESGEGNLDGLLRTEATRSFRVTLTSGETDSETGLLDVLSNPIGPVASRYPIGQQHPNAPILIVLNWSQPNLVDGGATRTIWIVDVQYGLSIFGVGSVQFDVWEVEFGFALETENPVKDLDGKLIGSHAYREPITNDDGSRETARFRGKTLDGWVKLTQVTDLVVSKQVQRFKPASSIILSKQVANLTLAKVKQAETYISKVISTPFITGEKGTLLIGAPRITPSRSHGSAAGAITAAVYDVELHFIKNEAGWEKERIFDRFEQGNTSGEIVPIEGTGQVFTDFRLYETADPWALLGIFGSRQISMAPGKSVLRRSEPPNLGIRPVP